MKINYFFKNNIGGGNIISIYNIILLKDYGYIIENIKAIRGLYY
jgi:hypothetical protein